MCWGGLGLACDASNALEAANQRGGRVKRARGCAREVRVPAGWCPCRAGDKAVCQRNGYRGECGDKQNVPPEAECLLYGESASVMVMVSGTFSFM